MQSTEEGSLTRTYNCVFSFSRMDGESVSNESKFRSNESKSMSNESDSPEWGCSLSATCGEPGF